MDISNKPLYLQLADTFRSYILLGVYKPGEALPSVREVAISYGANPATVVRAYDALIEEGLLSSVPKRGYYVKGKETDRKETLKKLLTPILESGYTESEIKEAIAQWKSK